MSTFFLASVWFDFIQNEWDWDTSSCDKTSIYRWSEPTWNETQSPKSEPRIIIWENRTPKTKFASWVHFMIKRLSTTFYIQERSALRDQTMIRPCLFSVLTFPFFFWEPNPEPESFLIFLIFQIPNPNLPVIVLEPIPDIFNGSNPRYILDEF